MQQQSQPWVITIRIISFTFIFIFYSLAIQSSIEDYIYSDIGDTSNIHGEVGLINIPSSRILDEGYLKLHLVNSDPINSLLISANPFNWMEVSLRYADINTEKYSPYPQFSGKQTYKDKSFNLKVRLIEETDNFPELSVGFRDFIGTGKFAGEYIVSSKRIGDFDFTVGLGWGSLSNSDGIHNPFIDIDDHFKSRFKPYGRGGDLEFDRWFTGEKVSSFYGVEYVNKFSGIRFKLDYDSSNAFNLPKKSDFAFGLSIPASKFIDINLFRHRGNSLGFGISYKANYANQIVKKTEFVNQIIFNQSDKLLLSDNDEIFSGTINMILREYGIFTQEIFLSGNEVNLIVDQSRYRNLNTATKRIVELTRTILQTRDIKKISITYKTGNVNIGQVNFSLNKFEKFIDNSLSLSELNNFLEYSNYKNIDEKNKIFQGIVKYPFFYWGFKPDLKNHIGAPEAFYSGQIGILAGGGVNIDKNSNIDTSISLSIYQNLDQLRLISFSRLPKVRSDIREYLQEKYALRDLTYTYISDPIYSENFLFFGGLKVGLFEEMFGGVGGEIALRDITQPWYISANYYWVKQRDFNQRLSFRNYETFTGHLNFTWETPIEGVKLVLSGGRYLAKDSGITVNMSKTFKTGFTIGFFATKTDISTLEFGEGSFDKGIYFSIPLDIVSSGYRKENARFVWRNLTRDGGAMLSGGLGLDGYIENTSSNFLDYISDGFYE